MERDGWMAGGWLTDGKRDPLQVTRQLTQYPKKAFVLNDKHLPHNNTFLREYNQGSR